jgi:hypothetical protein
MIIQSISPKEAISLFEQLPEVLQQYLMSRAGEHAIAPHELLMKIPKSLLDNPIEIFKFLKSKDISHLIATSQGGSSTSFHNWTFEDATSNSVRQEDPMRLEEYLNAQLKNQSDAIGIEFGTPDPSSHGYNAAYRQAFGSEAEVSIDIDLLSKMLSDPSVTAHALWDGMGEALRDLGIPIAYLTFKVGFGGIFPFLRTIDWMAFKTDSRYRSKTLARAMRAFREGGWKEAAKAFLIGFLIAVFPPLSYFMAAMGFTGLAALGARWLASKAIKVTGALEVFLNGVASVLEIAHKFLKAVLAGFEKVAEVLIEVATGTVKKVYSVGKRFAGEVCAMSASVARDLCRRASSAATKTAQLISGWVLDWFGTLSAKNA